MQTIYQLGAGNIWTGASEEIADTAGVPAGWVSGAVPEPGDGQVAQWFGSVWAYVPDAVQTAAALVVAQTQFAAAQAAVAAEIEAQFNAVITTGYPTGGYHVAIDDGARANFAGMAVTAFGVLGGTLGLTWPVSYQNWFSIEGASIPLPTPADGIALANAAGGYYSQAVVNEAALLTAVAEATTSAELEAINPVSGWA